MGFKKSLDVANIVQQINAAAYSVSSPYTDGFNGWCIKQYLYQIKEILDDAICRCPEFGTIELEWLKEREQKKIIKILKNEN
jgi:hypothetical protein